MSSLGNKIGAAFDVLTTGREIANPALWKAGGITANYIIALLSAIVVLLNQFDCSICSVKVSAEQMVSLSAGIIAFITVIQNFLTAMTSKKASINPVKNIKILQRKEIQEIPEVSEDAKKIIMDDINA